MSAAPHQASCVAIHGSGVLIEGPPGSGKSSLALALIDRGATLVGDDGVLLETRGGRLWALPPPNIAGLIEIRNVGIARLPTAEAPVALLLRLHPKAPRQPEGVETIVLAGLRIPALDFYPGGPIPALRAEWALALHGIPLGCDGAQTGVS